MNIDKPTIQDFTFSTHDHSDDENGGILPSAGNWDSVYTQVFSNSALWDAHTDITLIQSASADWNSNYTTFNGISASIIADLGVVNSNSADWSNHTDITYLNAIESASANYDSNYTVVNSNSADWSNHTDITYLNAIESASANYDSNYTVVNSNSSTWEGTNIYNNYTSLGHPQLFNPTTANLTANNGDFTLSTENEVGLVTINGQVVDDSEYSLVGSDITITPDNGFSSITDEILVFQNTFSLSGATNVTDLETIVNSNSSTWSTGSLGFAVNNNGSPVLTGNKGYFRIPTDCIIQEYQIVTDIAGSATLDIYVDTFNNYPPTSADSICSTNKPTISAGVTKSDATLTNWNIYLSAGDYISYNIDSVSTVTYIALTLVTLKV